MENAFKDREFAQSVNHEPFYHQISEAPPDRHTNPFNPINSKPCHQQSIKQKYRKPTSQNLNPHPHQNQEISVKSLNAALTNVTTKSLKHPSKKAQFGSSFSLEANQQFTQKAKESTRKSFGSNPQLTKTSYQFGQPQEEHYQAFSSTLSGYSSTSNNSNYSLYPRQNSLQRSRNSLYNANDSAFYSEGSNPSSAYMEMPKNVITAKISKDGETPYVIKIPRLPQGNITLKDFKYWMPIKNGNFRYFFKTIFDNEEVYEEVIHDFEKCPMFDDKLIVKCQSI